MHNGEDFIQRMNEDSKLILVDYRFLSSYIAQLEAKVNFNFGIEPLAVDFQSFMLPKRSPLKVPFSRQYVHAISVQIN